MLIPPNRESAHVVAHLRVLAARADEPKTDQAQTVTTEAVVVDFGPYRDEFDDVLHV